MENKRNFFRSAVVFALILCFLPLKAQKYDNKYYMSLWGALGYANLLHNVPGTTPIGGAGGLVGLGFEYNYKNFILTFGAEFDYKNTTTRVKNLIPEYNTGLHHEIGEIEMDDLTGKPVVVQGVIDTEGDEFIMLYDFSKYKDNYHTTYVNFPLLMGGQFNTFYFLMGGKFGLFFGRESSVKTDIKTAGRYAQFIDDFVNMKDHFFWDYTTSKRRDVQFGFNVVASMEIGKVFYPKKSKTHYRLAAFADYGVLNIHKNIINGPLIKFAPDNAVNLDLTSVLSAERSRNSHVNPLLVGVKFTILFDLGNKEPCQCIPEYKSKWKQK